MAHTRIRLSRGAAEKADLEVHWASGRTDEFPAVSADRLITLREGEGIVKTEIFRATASRVRSH